MNNNRQHTGQIETDRSSCVDVLSNDQSDDYLGGYVDVPWLQVS